VLSLCPGERNWVGSQEQDLPVKGYIEALSSLTSLVCEGKSGNIRAQFRASSDHAMHQEVHNSVKR